MSANVWFEQVDAGLLEELKNTIRIKSNGVTVTLPDNAFIIRKPEEDMKFETFPCVSIYNKSYKHDPVRYDPIPVVVSEDKTNNRAELEDPAVPYNLSYQIDFWARYQTDMNEMTRTWLLKHFRSFNLSVVDDGGNERSCNVMVDGSIIKSDLVQNKERLFHSIVNCTIWVELDDETRYNVPIVINRGIETHPSTEREES